MAPSGESKWPLLRGPLDPEFCGSITSGAMTILDTTTKLRPTTHDDLDFVLNAERDPDNRPWIIPWTRAQHESAFGNSELRHILLADDQLGRMGFVILGGLQSPHGAIEFRRVVVVAKGRGIGRAAIRLVQALAFDELNAHRLWLDVKATNARARSLYDSAGFVVEGTLRECLRTDTGFESLVVMSMLRSEYRRDQ
jgi:RimJ/RimL family protein N-acetyltransferase